MLGLHFQNMFNQTLYWEILACLFFSYLIFKNHKCVTNNRQQNQTRFPHYNKTRNSKPQTDIKKFFCWNRPPRALSCFSKRPFPAPFPPRQKKSSVSQNGSAVSVSRWGFSGSFRMQSGFCWWWWWWWRFSALPAFVETTVSNSSRKYSIGNCA